MRKNYRYGLRIHILQKNWAFFGVGYSADDCWCDCYLTNCLTDWLCTFCRLNMHEFPKLLFVAQILYPVTYSMQNYRPYGTMAVRVARGGKSLSQASHTEKWRTKGLSVAGTYYCCWFRMMDTDILSNKLKNSPTPARDGMDMHGCLKNLMLLFSRTAG